MTHSALIKNNTDKTDLHNPKALYERGNAFHEQMHLKEAIWCYQNAIKIKPDYVEAYYDLGAAFHQQKNFDKAIACYKQVITLKPEYSIAHYNIGILFHIQQKYNDAIDYYKKTISLNPNMFEVWYNLGNAYIDQGNMKDAISCYKKALHINPSYADAYYNLATTYRETGEFAKAADCFKQAIQLKPDFAQGHCNLGDMLMLTGNTESAITHFKSAIRLKPDFLQAYNNLGNALKNIGKIDQAIENYNQVIRLKPDLAEGYYNLGSAYRFTENLDMAEIFLKKALQLKPNYAEAYNNLGLTYKSQGNLNRAINCLTLAVKNKPDLADAHWNLSATLLLNGNFTSGWKEFEWRLVQQKWKSIYPYRYHSPRWDGSNALDKTIFVHDEQGLGDTIQFVRYMPLVKQKCKTVILETRKSLTDLLTDFPGIDEIVERSSDGNPRCKYDLYTPLLSLPWLFKTTQHTIPSHIPYLQAPLKKIDKFKPYFSTKTFNVGIVWAGRPLHLNDHNRSCTLKHFEGIAQIHGVNLYGLQKGNASRDDQHIQHDILVSNIGNEFDGFSDTAGAIEHLDLVISVDTSVAHLAGAMGKPVWVLLPYIPDWRWMMKRKDSPWYPTMRLFRQENPGDWKGVFRCVAQELKTMINN